MATSAAAAAAVSAGAAARNASVRAALSEALRTSQLKGAPAMPIRGAGPQASRTAAAASPPVSVAAVLGRYAFTNPDPKSHAAKTARLAAISFGGGMAERSLLQAPPREAVELSPALAAAFGPGGTAAVVAEMTEFAAASLTGGFTWLVVRGERIPTTTTESADSTASTPTEPIVEVLNTPAHVSPLMLGYFPLACIDMTPEAYLVPPATTAAAAPTTPKAAYAPSWSRAARNASVAFTAPAAFAIHVPDSDVPPSQRRALHAARCAAAIDWTFVASQFDKATAYFTSTLRQAKREARRTGLAAGAVSRLPKRSVATDVEEDAATVAAAAAVKAASDAVETATAAAAATTPSNEAAAAAEADGQSATASAMEAEVAEAAATQAASDAATTAAETTTPASTSTMEPAETAMAMSTAGPRPMPQGVATTLEDGSQQYHFADGSDEFVRTNGTRVVVRTDGQQEEYNEAGLLQFYIKANGTQVWPAQDAGSDLLRTVVEADGTTMYEYRTGATITKFPDGRTRTVFPDGQAVVEEAQTTA